MHRKKRWKLNAKIVVMILLVALAVSLMTGLVLYRYFSQSMVDRIKRDNQVKFDQAAGRLDEIYEEALRYGQQISIDPAVQALLSTEHYPSVVEELKAKKAVSDSLIRLGMLSQSIDSFALVQDGQVAAWTEVPFWDEQSRALCQNWYGALESAERSGAGVSAPYSFSFVYRNGEQKMDLISIRLPLYSMGAADERAGELIINISVGTLNAIVWESGEGFDGLAYFCGQQPLVLAEEGSAGAEELLPQADRGGAGGFPLYFQKDTALGGTLVGRVQYPSPLGASWASMAGPLLILLFAGILIVALLIPMMLHLTRPVTVLAGAMKRVGAGDMSTRVDIRTNDEFETLGQELNQMVRRLDGYIGATLQNEKDKHELEYEVLVAQINPHFIYNTLNTVIYLAKKEKSGDVVRITRALIDLLQDGIRLSDNKNFSTVEEELWIIHNYVCIQNYRYQGKFELVVDCPEELKKRQIPTSVIQPLVENALFHGIVPLDRSGTIRLEIRLQARGGEDWLHICVADDGVGIPEEKIQAILQGRLELTEASRNHVGVQNIVKRLSLLYGERYELNILSQEGKGTRVEAAFPEKGKV